MTVLSGQSIRRRGIFTPFEERTKHLGMSYGLGPAGYDVRVKQTVVLPPAGFALASTIERFVMPEDVIAFVHDKSTWARRGLSVFNTVIEPGWTGWLTLELVNNGRETLEILAGMPIAQVICHELDEPTENPYQGKYNGQANEPVPAILEGHEQPRLPFLQSTAES